MDPVQAKLEALEKKIDAIYVSTEKTRKYFFWTGVVTAAVIVLPLLVLPFVLGPLLSYYGNISDLSNLGI